MSFLIYIIAKSKESPLLVGVTGTSKLRDALNFHHSLPAIIPNKLYFIEVIEDKEEAKQRFIEVNTYNRQQKIALIESWNPDWQVVQPGINLDI